MFILIGLLFTIIITSVTADLKNITAIEQASLEDCSSQYKMNCFLLHLSKLIDRVKSINQYQLLPGVFLVAQQTNTTNHTKESIPHEILERFTNRNSSVLIGNYVMKKFNSLLNSLSLNIKIMDPRSAFNIRTFSDEFIQDLINGSIRNGDGRGKKKDKEDSDKLKALLWTAGSMAAVSALFTLTGKAAVASILALLLGVACLLKNHNNNGGGGAGFSRYQTAALIDTSSSETLVDIGGRSQHIIVEKNPPSTWDLTNKEKPAYSFTSPYQDYPTYIIRRTT